MSDITHITPPQPEEVTTPAKQVKADWRAMMDRLTYKGIVKNIPFLAFLAVLCMLYIGNSQRAVETQRELNAQNQILKELRYKHMDINNKLMTAGMEPEIIRRGVVLGLNPLTLPAYSITPDSTKPVTASQP